MPNCKDCGEVFSRSQTIEMSGVPDDLADEAYDLMLDGDTCAECIVTDLAYRDSMEELYA